MTRRCSHCSNNGHNSRTCPNRGLKLFGVRITDGSIRKSASMGNLTYYTGSGTTGSAGGTDLDSTEDTPDHNNAADGYGSEDFVAGSSSGRERKKGVPWTEEEHKMFLQGLQKLGKGDWRGIAKNYVISRTPTQVASHAQKYFIRQCNMSRRKRRSSLFDMVADDGNPSLQSEPPSANNLKCVPTPEEEVEECESVDPPINLMHREGTQYFYPVMFPAYVSPFMPVAIPFWAPVPQPAAAAAKTESHEVLKPTAVHSKSPINVDELVGLSKLSLGESIGDGRPNSLKVVGSLIRQSAFHANNPNPASSGHSPIHAAV